MKKRYNIFFAFLTLLACQRPQQQSQPEPVAVNKFADPNLQTIYTLQDERNTESLLPYLQHPKVEYRREAALAFASVQDTLAVPQLLGMLTDTTAIVRQAAAYALGQIGHRKAEEELIQHLPQEQDPQVQAELLEALGKVATPVGVNFLATHNAPNETARAGQAWGLYRAGLRQLYTYQGMERAVKFLEENNPYEVRLGAAHFLARTPKLDLTPFRKQLVTVATSDQAPEVRMAVTQALAKIGATEKAAILSGIAQSDPDYRVRLSAIRSMTGLEFASISEALMAALNDENINTAIATAEFLQANYNMVDASLLYEAMTDDTLKQKEHGTVQDARVSSSLFWILLRKGYNEEYHSRQVKQFYQYAQSPYDKAHYLKALSGHFGNYKFIEDQTFTTKHPVVATYGMEALILMRQQPDFPKEMEQDFAATLKRAIASGDVALVGLAAGGIRDPKLNFRQVYQDHSFLREAQQKLVLPRDMETNIELQKTLDFLSGRQETTQPRNPFTHPINWSLVQVVPANQQVLIRTEKGNITLQLFVEDAPGSVGNFVELTKQRFYDGLFFHRVVPNFVAQGGDKRGDGWGSSDYSIRSEFAPLNYREGYVGMASAGKDTESNQWFITHSPAPHLDGRYTIFARVIEGMEVVHQLEVGDKIIAVELR